MWTAVVVFAAALSPSPINVNRRAVIAGALSLPHTAHAYGLTSRPARDFSGMPNAEGRIIDPTFENEAKRVANEAAAKTEKAALAKYGAAITPTNKAQEKLAKAREQAQARAAAQR